MRKNKEGNFTSKSTTKISATETSRKVEFEIPNDEIGNVTAGIFKVNHLKGLYQDYCILNQEFLKYVISLNFTAREYKIFLFILAKMDNGNKVLLANQFIADQLGLDETNVSRVINKFVREKIILKKRYGTSKYEVLLNYDVLNPQMVFKGKSSKDNLEMHKAIIAKEGPYVRQSNIFGGVDLVNRDGVIFDTYNLIEPEELE